MTRPLAVVVLSSVMAAAAASAAVGATGAAAWPEEQRAFLEDGPALLLTAELRRELVSMPAADRAAFVASFLRDPIPQTPANELVEAIERRRRLAETVAVSPTDARWRLAFLRGLPQERQIVTCSAGYRPIEIWGYPTEPSRPGGEPEVRQVLLFQPSAIPEWRHWEPPTDAKTALYTDEMASFMEQWELYEGKRFRAVRFDVQLCRQESELLDRVTGINALTTKRRQHQLLASPFAPPPAVDEWARAALAEELAEAPPSLPIQDVAIAFPGRQGSDRIVTRVSMVIAPDAALGVDREGDEPRVRLEVDGIVEQDGAVFDRLRVRYTLPPPEPGAALPLALEIPLRPGRGFVVRLRVKDAVGGGEARLVRGFVVATEPQPVADLPLSEAVMQQVERGLDERIIPGADSVLLVPPQDDVVLGRWRAEALVSGERIVKVVMILDGSPLLTITRRPFSAELPLSLLPQEHVVRAEGYDAEGNLVASDEIVVNLPRGSLRVRILEPRRGAPAAERTRARAMVVVPEGKKVERVEFRLGDEVVAVDHVPPWEQWLEVPAGGGDLTYLSVVAYLDDGQVAEDVRFLGGGGFVEEMEVDLVELYAAVVDRAGRLVSGLVQEDFTVREDGRPQQIRRFEVAENIPLAVGVAMDVSSSMEDHIEEAKAAAIGFLDAVVRPGDRTFAVTFADRPKVLHPPTADVAAVTDLLSRQRAYGWTTLHDAILTSLYYFRGLSGQKALILLSDGDDTGSNTGFREALEYSRRSGVAIYPIGLGIDRFSIAIRQKLDALATETGGRVFYIKGAADLAGIYGEIEQELRTRYLLAYVSDRPDSGDGAPRKVDVTVRGRGLEARTMRGYYP